jgi:hypothetical protein
MEYFMANTPEASCVRVFLPVAVLQQSTQIVSRQKMADDPEIRQMWRGRFCGPPVVLRSDAQIEALRSIVRTTYT